MSKRTQEECCCCWCQDVDDNNKNRRVDYDPVSDYEPSANQQLMNPQPVLPPVNPSREVRTLSGPVPVPPPVHAPSKSVFEELLSKPNIIQRTQQLVLPSYTTDGELRQNGLRENLFPVPEDEELVSALPPPNLVNPPPPAPSLRQYTPNYSPGGAGGSACVDYQTSVTNSYPGLRHDPDGIYWLTPAQWTAAQWDGVTIWDPATNTAAQVSAGIFPTVNTMRGLRELFYSINPFADNQNPTVPEIDNWNIEVLRHFRRLLGRSETDWVDNDASLYYQAHWATERYKTTVWDSRYPYDAGKPGTWGPCVVPGAGENAHCGASFIPSCADQVPYFLDPAQPCVTDTSFAEGIFSVNTNLPWSIKFARTIAITLLTDGLGGHTGPFLGGRSKIGLSWMCGPTTSSLRVKWGGSSEAPPPPPPPAAALQYTPAYSPAGVAGSSCMNSHTAYVVSLGMRHDPAGVTWISQQQWDAAIWDGVTTYNPCTMTAQQLYDAIWPNPYGPNIKAMRGLRQLYEQLQPFADVLAPTVPEIEEWNLQVIKHLRRLLGLSDATYPLVNDKALYYRAHWSMERLRSSIWDARYPANPAVEYWGPCNGTVAHCGASFLPNCEDQIPYFMDPAQPCITDNGVNEGMFVSNREHPWCVKLSIVLAGLIKSEGITGHVVPILRNSKIGMSWSCTPSGHVDLKLVYGFPQGPPICG